MKQVIVVEDDPVNATLFRMLLERRNGCRVTVTESADEVMAIARAGAHAVILDVSLRDSSYEGRPVNGVDICRLLKSDPRTRTTPVILATAHAMRGDDQKLLADSGTDDYVSKPILDLEAFAKQIQTWLGEAAA